MPKHSDEIPFKEDGEEYAVVEQMLGGKRLLAHVKGSSMLCKIRGNFRRSRADWVSKGDVLLISVREFQESKADVLYKYRAEEVRFLRRIGELDDLDVVGPADAEGGGGGADAGDDGEDLIVFDDI